MDNYEKSYRKIRLFCYSDEKCAKVHMQMQFIKVICLHNFVYNSKSDCVHTKSCLNYIQRVLADKNLKK